MDIFWYIISGFFILFGFIGSIVPIIPGPSLSYVAILILHFTGTATFTTKFLVIWVVIVVVVTAIDYVVPAYGTKKLGGSKRGIWGSVIGLIIGFILFPPFGIIIGPLLGAFLGELSAGKDSNKAFMSALGSFMGFLLGTILKLIISGYLAYYYIASF